MSKHLGQILILAILTFLSRSGIVLALSAEELVKIYEDQAFRNRGNVNNWVNLSKAYSQLARDALDFSQHQMAHNVLLKAFSLDSANLEAQTQLAQIKFSYHQFEEAIAIANRVLEKSPNKVSTWGVLGDIYLALGKTNQADSCYKKMYKKDKGLYSLARFSGLAHVKGEYRKALGMMQKAVTIGKKEGYFYGDQAWTNVQLGNLYLTRGNLKKALQSAEKALAILPAYLPALIQKAKVLAVKGEIRTSIEIYEQVIQKTPDPESKSNLAKIYLAVGKRPEADSLLNLAKQQFQEYWETHPEAFNFRLAEFYLSWNINLEQALELAQEELEARQDPQTYDLTAWAYFKKGDYQKAWENITLALSKKNKEPKILFHAATISKALGKEKEAEKFFSEAKSLNPFYDKMYLEN